MPRSLTQWKSKILGLLFLIVASILTTACAGFVRYLNDEAVQTNMAENGGFRLRISRLESAPGIMPPSRYRVEASTNDGPWAEAYRWSQDDPWDVSDIDLRTLSSEVGYFFRTTEFGVTVDAGVTWKLFDVYEAMKKDGSAQIVSRFDRGVPRVTINEDGTGSIYSQSYYDESGPTQEIYSTTDFGQTWHLEESARASLRNPTTKHKP